MQDARELARDRDDRAQHARSLGDPQAPRAQGRPCPDPQQKARSRLAQRLPNGNVPLLTDAAFIVDGRARLVSPRRQAKMRPDRSRSREAPGVIDTHFERKGRNGTDARHRHQTTADRIMLNHLQERAMQSFVALEDRPPHIQHGLDSQGEDRIAVLEQLADAEAPRLTAPMSNP
jgi:hypothetical protein